MSAEKPVNPYPHCTAERLLYENLLRFESFAERSTEDARQAKISYEALDARATYERNMAANIRQAILRLTGAPAP